MALKRGLRYTAIDVGTTKVATLVARMTSKGVLEIEGFGYAASEGMKKGLVVSPDDLTESVRKSARDASRMIGNRPLPPAFVGITGAHLTCLNAASEITREVGKRAGSVSQEDVDDLLRTAFPTTHATRKLVAVVPRQFQVDAQGGVRNPVGMKGARLWAESHVVVGDAQPMDNLARVVKAAGVKMRGMVMEHLASAEAVLTADEREVGCVLVDIGGGTSDVAIFKDGTVWHTAAIPVAGHLFTNDVAIGLGIPPAAAEYAKIHHGSASMDGVNYQTSLEIDAGERSGRYLIAQHALNQLLHDRAVELIRLILAKVAESGLDRVPAGGIVLTGGCANLKGLPELMASYTGCPVRVALPSTAHGLPEQLENTAFSTAVGLLLWSIRYRHAGAIVPEVTVSTSMVSRFKDWLSKFGAKRPTEVNA